MKFLLDTDTISFAIRGVGRVGRRLLACTPDDIAISTVSEAELYFGLSKRRSKRLTQIVEGFLVGLTILPFDSAAAKTYGGLRHKLEARGTPIGIADTMCAAHAMSQGMTIVTGNTKHFRRIRGLRTQDWR